MKEIKIAKTCNYNLKYAKGIKISFRNLSHNKLIAIIKKIIHVLQFYCMFKVSFTEKYDITLQ